MRHPPGAWASVAPAWRSQIFRTLNRMSESCPAAFFEQLRGEQLSAVTFVQDYLQLSFDGPTINVMNPLTVEAEGRSIISWQPGFRDLLCAKMTKVVAATDYRNDHSLRIQFEDGACLAISLREADYTSPEAIYAHGFTDHGWFVA